MAEAKLISKEWSDEVQLFLEATTEGGVPDDRGNVRLSKALRDAKPEAYVPQMVSLGPYHHFSLKDEAVGPFHKRLTHLSQMEMYKLRSAREAARNDPQLIKSMFARVSHPDMISELEKFYDWEIKKEDVPDFAWMMMVDALFLSYFLKSGFDDVDRAESSVRRGASKDVVVPARASIRCDIVKLENQIPLSLLRKLEEIAKDPNTLESLLPSITRRLSSFRISVNEEKGVKGKGGGVDGNKDDEGKRGVNEEKGVKEKRGVDEKKDDKGKREGVDEKKDDKGKREGVDEKKDDKEKREGINEEEDDKGKRQGVDEKEDHKRKREGVAEKTDDKGKGEDFDEKHMLGCIHRHVSSFLQVSGDEEEPPTWRQWIANVMENVVAGVFSVCYRHPARRGRQDFLEKYSAKELAKAGIKFESFNEQGKIRFSKNSDTLYLPQITIFDTYTEVLLRNLLALEFNESGRDKHVSNYVELMDCLIDTPEDVALLRESHVIERQSMMITDEYVAKMWDGMSKPFFLAGFLELPGGLKGKIREVLIKSYHKSKIKTQLSELYSEYLSSPWKVVALLVGFFVLLLTVLQTYCSVHDCEIERRPKANARKLLRPFG